jgi:hypothetical protein
MGRYETLRINISMVLENVVRTLSGLWHQFCLANRLFFNISIRAGDDSLAFCLITKYKTLLEIASRDRK